MKIFKNKVISFVSAVVFLSVVVILSSVFNERKESIKLFTDENNTCVTAFRGGKELDEKAAGRMSQVYFSPGNYVSAVQTVTEKGYELWIFSENGCRKVFDGSVSSLIFSSDSAQFVFNTPAGEIYRGSTGSGKVKKLYSSLSGKFSVSPDCSKIIYETDEGLYLNGKFILSGYLPAAVSDSGDRIYAESSDNKLVMLDKDFNISANIAELSGDNDNIVFSSDMKTLFFSDKSGSFVFSREKGKHKLGDKIFSFAGNAVECSSDGDMLRTYSSVVPGFFTSGGNLIFADKDYNISLLSDNFAYFKTYGKKALFTDKSGNLSFFDGENTRIAENVFDEKFDMSSNTTYFIDSDKKFAAVKKGKTYNLADGASSFALFGKNYDVISSGALYTGVGTKEKQLVLDFANDIYTSESAVFAAYNLKSGKFNILVSSDGRYFDKVEGIFRNIA